MLCKKYRNWALIALMVEWNASIYIRYGLQSLNYCHCRIFITFMIYVTSSPSANLSIGNDWPFFHLLIRMSTMFNSDNLEFAHVLNIPLQITTPCIWKYGFLFSAYCLILTGYGPQSWGCIRCRWLRRTVRTRGIVILDGNFMFYCDVVSKVCN